MPEKRTVRILSIDGGGIRGIIPALVLAEIERRSSLPISSMFDLIAGSSTGGLLAMGLTIPDKEGNPIYTAEQAAAIYEVNGTLIFTRSMWHVMQSMNSLLTTKYPTGGMERLLQDAFGDARMADVLTEVFITGYEIQRRQPWFFRSSSARQSREHNFRVRDVVRATTAAPTYFEPARIDTDEEGQYLALIDGSVSASHPALLAYIEARDLYPDADRFVVVSIGTGDDMTPLDYDEARGWGLAAWVQPLIGLTFHAMNETLDYQMEKLLPPLRDGKRNYYRFQTSLEGASIAMDDATPQNIAALKILAGRLIEQNSDLIDELVAQLTLPEPQPEALPEPQKANLSPVELIQRWYQQLTAPRNGKPSPVKISGDS